MAGGHMPLRTTLFIDGVPIPRTSDWFVNEKAKRGDFGSNDRTINGELITNLLPGFDKWILSWTCNGVRRHPCFNGLVKGTQCLIRPIKEIDCGIPAGQTVGVFERTPAAGTIIVHDDSDFALLVAGVDYTMGGPNGRTITLAHAWPDLITARFRWEAQFKLDELDKDWAEQTKEGGWSMTWLEC